MKTDIENLQNENINGHARMARRQGGGGY